ncbi:DUF1254 domain-containing protein [Actinacidiphila bryophytorum]|uniref:DUF1254 domain-containing protein n=1 Tax=Actinacidiphila bryophytorum TaxID=1436133 RepID=UPI0021769BE2|nr:DUF1254 domain-containing protein [Actinacidiphila bryophytorum]UWE07744.1 DUF1254 domain-containing protein [Actinacidiphila bryophytorum]
MGKLGDDLGTLSREAYFYLYPLVTMDVSRRQAVGVPAGVRPGFGPANAFHHLREFPAADFRAVVRPNFDTLYSNAWLDLTGGPVRLSVADTGGRYFMLPMLDMWTDVFAAPGSRTTGTGPQEYTVVGPGYGGDIPAGTQVVRAPTPYVWVIGRTQTDGPADYPAVNAVQDGFRLTPLSPDQQQLPDPDSRTAPGADAPTEPLALVNGLTGTEFLARACDVLATVPPHPTDFSVLARIADLGVVPGQPFDAGRFSADQLAEIDAGATHALAQMRAAQPTLGTQANGWSSVLQTIGVYGNDYFQRAVVTLLGLGANPPDDAVYPLLNTDADGERLTGAHDYVIHFDADALPPVEAFWSVTMYDAEGFQAPNELDRYALGDRDPLTYNADGSLDLHLGRENPGPEREPNWLPAPEGPLGVTLRLYAPRAQVLDGRWTPPAVRKA